ncbi:uncharacterized protein LOC122313469 [Carya illinoinensis]|uniref:uncharacterized protein LOC122313469 n=1 Tax=Carya illinoinensis TaxID=32201 RepID=UPI001C726107|nr:uncharacterized protein LOC122313469 [Carya illinoinensis]
MFRRTNSQKEEISRSMGKQNIKEENNNMDASKPSTQNIGVIISVYVESPKTQSPLMRTVPVKKTKPKPVSKKPQTSRKQVEYSDRRAQLLAYARELRSSTTAASDPQDQIQLPRNNLKAKPKLEQEKWEWIMAPASICCPSRRRLERARRQWRYERVPVEENAENADQFSVVSESIGAGKKRKSTTRRSSRNSTSFLNKLRCRLRELSC